MKYIVCFPGGGFNDMLCVINRCLKHAVKYNRLLIIDTTKAEWFVKDIRDYISFNHPNIYVGDLNSIYLTLRNLSIYPENMGISLTCSKISWSFRTFKMDLNKDYTEDVLVYYMSGGGIPYEILKHTTFKPNILNIYYERFNKIPLNYNSFHIRNTDKKTKELESFIEQHKNKLKELCFLASDDTGVINRIRNINKDVVTFAQIPIRNPKQKNIHYHHATINHETFITDCIVDLLLLASGKNLYYSCQESGYSKLAKYLHDNKSIFHKLINIENSVAEKLVHVVEKIVPVVEKIVPVVEKIAPVVEKIVPVVEKIVPVVEKIVPVVEKIVPVVEKIMPVLKKIMPIAEKPVHVMKKTVPVAEKPVHLVKKIVPNAEKPVHVVKKIVPNAEKPVHVVKKPVHVVKKTTSVLPISHPKKIISSNKVQNKITDISLLKRKLI